MHRSFVQYKLMSCFILALFEETWKKIQVSPHDLRWKASSLKWRVKRNFSRSSIVTILFTLINNCFSSSGSYSNFCLKLLSIQDFSDSLMISYFFTFEASSEGERKRGKLNLIWVLISNLSFKSSSSRTCCSSRGSSVPLKKVFFIKQFIILCNSTHIITNS